MLVGACICDEELARKIRLRFRRRLIKEEDQPRLTGKSPFWEEKCILGEKRLSGSEATISRKSHLFVKHMQYEGLHEDFSLNIRVVTVLTYIKRR